MQLACCSNEADGRVTQAGQLALDAGRMPAAGCMGCCCPKAKPERSCCCP